MAGARVAVSLAGRQGNTTVPAATTHYTVPKRAWEPTGNGGYVHSAVLSALPVSTAVTYRPQGTDRSGRAVDLGEFTFATAPSVPTTTKIVLLADQGTFMGFGGNVTSQMIRDFGPYASHFFSSSHSPTQS